MTDNVFIEIDGLEELDKFIDRVSKKAPQELDMILLDATLETQKNAVQSIKKPSTGRLYKRNDVMHRASKAGEAPNTDTGNLVSNITYERRQRLDYDVGSRKGAPYGLWLEFGTRSIAPRPWLRPSSEKAIKGLEKALKNVRLV